MAHIYLVRATDIQAAIDYANKESTAKENAARIIPTHTPLDILTCTRAERIAYDKAYCDVVTCVYYILKEHSNDAYAIFICGQFIENDSDAAPFFRLADAFSIDITIIQLSVHPSWSPRLCPPRDYCTSHGYAINYAVQPA